MIEHNYPSIPDEAYQFARYQLVTKRRGLNFVEDYLFDKGLTREQAKVVVEKIKPEIPPPGNRNALRMVISGLLIAVGAGAVSAFSYFYAAGTGGNYFVFTGLIGSGIVTFFRGLYKINDD